MQHITCACELLKSVSANFSHLFSPLVIAFVPCKMSIVNEVHHCMRISLMVFAGYSQSCRSYLTENPWFAKTLIGIFSFVQEKQEGWWIFLADQRQQLIGHPVKIDDLIDTKEVWAR